MQTSRKLTHALVALFALVLMSATALAADPGADTNVQSDISDQKAGSILVYNLYSSAAAPTPTHNTRINITNTNTTNSVIVHLFFVADNCTVADFKLPLTENQTFSFVVSEFDPGFNGYIIAIATDSFGVPISFNFLIGDEYVKLPTGHSANLGAEAVAALFPFGEYPPGIGSQDPTQAVLASLVFDSDQNYNKFPAVLAADNVPSRGDGNVTILVINRLEGNLADLMASVPRLFALVFDDAETAYSTNFVPGGCQRRIELNDTEPRTVPRFTQIIPQGRDGWIKFYSTTGNVPLLGAQLNFNPNVAQRGDVFNGGHNLHKLRLTGIATVITMPVFPF
ncbi:MAG: hypothetical protein L0226_02050 [Acidobacteria bacterium]|nr:hypothetical protein [Acidobacteriota bacterium]